MKRIYKSETREAQAVKTRTSILKSALQLFKQHGFDRVTIQQIAAKADVSMPTVYSLFKSKRGVLTALIDEALPKGKFETLVTDSMTERSPVKRLAITASLARQIYDAEKGLMELLRGAAVLSPELKELEQEREMRRYERQKEYVKQFQKEGSLIPGLTLERARDLLWALTGRDLYRMLVIEQGWASDAYEKWLAHLLVKSLIS